MRREAVVGQGLPVGKTGNQLIGKLADLIMQAQGVLHIRRDQHHWPLMTLCNFRNQRGAGCAGQFTQLALVARFAGQGKTILFRHGFVRIS